MTVVDYDISPCKKCDRIASCDFPCQQYSDAELEHDLAKKNRDIEFSDDVFENIYVRENPKYYNDLLKSIRQLKSNDVGVKVGNDTDIENFLDYSVEDIIWLHVLKGKVAFTQLFDKNSFLTYLEEENDKYCERNGLCNECRSPLERQESYEEVCGSRRLVEVDYRCSRGC